MNSFDGVWNKSHYKITYYNEIQTKNITINMVKAKYLFFILYKEFLNKQMIMIIIIRPQIFLIIIFLTLYKNPLYKNNNRI